MKRRILLAIPALVVACVGLFVWKWRASDWAFVRQVTGFEFPDGTKYLAHYDNAEWFVMSVVELPEGEISAFERAHKFRTGDRARMIVADSLPPKYRHVPDRPDILTAAARTEYQLWNAVLDPQSRLLWIQIIYPDWSGDHSGTAPQPQSPVSITPSGGRSP